MPAKDPPRCPMERRSRRRCRPPLNLKELSALEKVFGQYSEDVVECGVSHAGTNLIKFMQPNSLLVNLIAGDRIGKEDFRGF